jgi:hypothetical protein
VSFRPTAVRATYRMEGHSGTMPSFGVSVGDHGLAYSANYVSGTSTPMNFNQCDPPDFTSDCGDIARATMSCRSFYGCSVDKIYLSNIEFLDGGVWKSYFCNEDL